MPLLKPDALFICSRRLRFPFIHRADPFKEGSRMLLHVSESHSASEMLNSPSQDQFHPFLQTVCVSQLRLLDLNRMLL